MATKKNANGEEYTPGNCSDCRAGEHSDYSEVHGLYLIRDPETKKLVKRAYLCSEHVGTYKDDGYEVQKLLSGLPRSAKK